MAGDDEGKRTWIKGLRYSAVGLEMGISVALCIALGRWIDGRWGTTPYFSVGLMLLGVVAGFYALIRTARQVQRDQKLEEENEARENQP